jgi:hypothetical protein
MDRRSFLLAAGAAATLKAAPDSSATILYSDRVTKVDRTSQLRGGADLWVRKDDLPRINDFHVKPEGACRADLCIPIPKSMKNGDWFNLSAFAHKVGQSYVNDPTSRAWSFGEIPAVTGTYSTSRVAPDFAVPDRKGKVVHLSDFRGKKVLVTTWASW